MSVFENIKTIFEDAYGKMEHHESRELAKEEWEEYCRQQVLQSVKDALLDGGIQDTISDCTSNSDKDMGLQEIILEQFKAVFKEMK